MRTTHDSADETRSSPDAPGRTRLRAIAGAATAVLLLAAAPLTAQQPRPAEPGETEQDPFAGSSIFDHSPDRGVTVSRLTLEGEAAPPLVSASDFYRASFVADWSALRPRGTTDRLLRTNPLGLEFPPTAKIGDRVVLSLGGLEVEPGDMLQAVRRGETMSDGSSVVHSLALVEVTKVDGRTARARVRSIYARYQVGDPVIAAEPFRAGTARALEPAGEAVVARITGLETPQVLVSTDDRLFLDAGSAAGLSPGDELAVFPEGTARPDEAPAEDRLGVVRVLRVREGSATARVVDTKQVGMKPGSVAVLVRRAASGER